MTAPGGYDAVMLIGFGGPTCAAEIRPFLDNVLRGRPVPRERYEAVVGHYEHMGGRSPYNDRTIEQARALERELRAGGVAIPVVVGMRNWRPYLADTLTALAGEGARRVLALIMAGFQCEASWERYQEAVESARSQLGANAPTVDWLERCGNHPLFIRAVAAELAKAFEKLEPGVRQRAHLIFTAHSIPVAMAARAPYVDQLTEACAQAAAAVGRASFTLAFQSRSGAPSEPWLEPDIGAALTMLKPGETAVVMPIGFLCDHVEVLYDLDRDAANVARAAGVTMVRAAALNDHPLFIQALAAMVKERLGA